MKSLLKSKKGATELGAGIKMAILFMGAILTLVILGFVIIIVAGNLSTSTGFAAGSRNQNITDAMLNNVSDGTAEFFSNATTWFSLLSIVIIIAVVIVVVLVVRKARGGSGTVG